MASARRYRLASLMHDQGKTEEALAQVRAPLAIRPQDAAANLLLGNYEHGLGNLAAAVERFEIVAYGSASDGVRARAYADLGFTYRQMGQLQKAKQCLASSLQLLGRQPTVIVTLGLIDERAGDLPGAVQQYSRAMAIQPTDVGYLLLAHVLEEEGRHSESDAMLQRAARLSLNLSEAQKRADALLAGSEDQ